MITNKLSVEDAKHLLSTDSLSNTVQLAQDLKSLKNEKAKIAQKLSETDKKLQESGLSNMSISEAYSELDKRKKQVLIAKNELEKEKNELNQLIEKNNGLIKERIDTKFSQIFGEKPAQSEKISFIVINEKTGRFELLMDPFVDFLKNNPGFTKINLTGFKDVIEDKDIQKLANYILFDKNTLATVVIVEGLKSRKITLSNLSNDQETQLKTIALDKLTFNDLKALAKALSNKAIDIKSPVKKV